MTRTTTNLTLNFGGSKEPIGTATLTITADDCRMNDAIAALVKLAKEFKETADENAGKPGNYVARAGAKPCGCEEKQDADQQS